jgi:hypothetical protein
VLIPRFPDPDKTQTHKSSGRWSVVSEQQKTARRFLTDH